MMNDMMPTIEEIATPDIAAEIEHREWERGNEERERWEAVEATHGPLLTAAEWKQHTIDMDQIIAEADAAWADFENALKCCLLDTSPSPRDAHESRMPSSA